MGQASEPTPTPYTPRSLLFSSPRPQDSLSHRVSRHQRTKLARACRGADLLGGALSFLVNGGPLVEGLFRLTSPPPPHPVAPPLPSRAPPLIGVYTLYGVHTFNP
jgi:hypothetical protein